MEQEFLRTRAVCARYGIARSTLYQRLKDGFPKPIFLRGGRCAFWKLSELVAYEAECAMQRETSRV
jgi:predicted DNA-binding transcriptional regulator AlpA